MFIYPVTEISNRFQIILTNSAYTIFVSDAFHFITVPNLQENRTKSDSSASLSKI